MSTREIKQHRVRNKGGKLGGRRIDYEAPAFDFDEFVKAPNAREFVKKAYDAATKKIAREIEEKKNGTVSGDLSTYELIIARSLNYTKLQIESWLKERDWRRIKSPPEKIEQIKNLLLKNLPHVATRGRPFSSDFSEKIAVKIIADLTEGIDPIAEHLFVMLTAKRESNDEALLL